MLTSWNSCQRTFFLVPVIETDLQIYFFTYLGKIATTRRSASTEWSWKRMTALRMSMRNVNTESPQKSDTKLNTWFDMKQFLAPAGPGTWPTCLYASLEVSGRKVKLTNLRDKSALSAMPQSEDEDSGDEKPTPENSGAKARKSLVWSCICRSYSNMMSQVWICFF